MKVSYWLPKNFRIMTPGPLGYVASSLSIALAQNLLEPSPRLLIPQPLVVLSFNLSPQTPPHHPTPATCSNDRYIAQFPLLRPSLLYFILLLPFSSG
jgi:hypothetical protein